MTTTRDFLVEIHTEELPPKILLKLSDAFLDNLSEGLQKAGLDFDTAKTFASPRRLAVLVHALSTQQPDQTIERRGPALAAAYDENGQPTPACLGFARSLKLTPDDLITIDMPEGQWVGYQQIIKGKLAKDILPEIIEQAAKQLPIPKRMRWGKGDITFIRPVHAVTLLLGSEIVPGNILGCAIDRKTRGHRFHTDSIGSTEWIAIPNASDYPVLLEQTAFVIADFEKRKNIIRKAADECVKAAGIDHAQVFISSEDFLNEITSLVEWPIALCGQFEEHFLSLPPEILISSMQDHQRYFPVMDKKTGKLLPHFVTISNIQSKKPARVIHGNERVLRARLADAAFFYEADKKISLHHRLSHLKNIVYQEKLGSLYDKSARVAKLSRIIAEEIDHRLTHDAERAGWLAKCDLDTQMVGEFPALQGIMGYYYSLHDGEKEVVASAIKEHYQPRFSGDDLPVRPLSIILGLADRIDTLAGAFGLAQIPTGDKDPFGLKRAAIGILRLIIAGQFKLDLKNLFTLAIAQYEKSWPLDEVVSQLLIFMQERARFFYQEQGVDPDVFAAVAALTITNPLDIHLRLQAVQQFKQLAEQAQALCIANKRVSHLLSKQAAAISSKTLDINLFDHPAESELAHAIGVQAEIIQQLHTHANYQEILLQLTHLRAPIDNFFDHVMVLCEDKRKRENRLILLTQLRHLFLQVADIALLQ
jgi:glycyl-tRNA synthetase beta chain